MDIQQLRKEKTEKTERMEELIEEEPEGWDEDFDELERDVEELNHKIERAEKLDDYQTRSTEETAEVGHKVQEDRDGQNQPATPKGEVEWRNIGEFVSAVYHLNENSQNRLTDKLRDYQSRVMEAGIGSDGGFTIPDEQQERILSVDPPEAIMRPRAQVIPAGDSPDASVKIPALDHSIGDDTAIYGGVSVQWTEENTTRSETDAQFRQVELDPHELAAFMEPTNKMLRNGVMFSDMIETQLRRAAIKEEDSAFIDGDGVSKPQGVVGATATVSVTRDTTNEINNADINALLDNLYPGATDPVFLANPRAKSELRTIEDSNGNNILELDASEALPGTLKGLPIFFSTRMPSVGSAGDLVLIDAAAYLIKDGFGLAIDVSTDAEFKTANTVIRLTHNVDGQPWLNDVIRAEDGNDYSFYVEIAA